MICGLFRMTQRKICDFVQFDFLDIKSRVKYIMVQTHPSERPRENLFISRN
jgi:hypothetical protein